jgi:hypothetical protein
MASLPAWLPTGSAGEVTFRVRNAEGGYLRFLSRGEPVRATSLKDSGLPIQAVWVFTDAGFEYWSSELFQIRGLDPRGNPPTKEEYLALSILCRSRSGVVA